MSASRHGGDTLTEAIHVRETARLVAGPQQVGAALDRMAQAAAEVLAHENPLVLAVMQGGVFTAVELCRRWEFPCEFDFVHVTRYGRSLRGGELDWRAWPGGNLSGRTVLLVDDILDQGVTLAEIGSRLRRSGVSRLYSAVLTVKRLAKPLARTDVDFVGLDVEDAYVFGCGMDYKGYWRGLNGIYAAVPPHLRDGGR